MREGWEEMTLGDISVKMTDGPFGSNLKSEHYTAERQVRIIQLSNIGEEGWREDNVKYTTFDHLETISRSEVFPNDIVIAKMMPAGRAIICPSHEQKFVLSSDAVKVELKKGFDCHFVNYSINSPYFRAQVYENVSGSGRVRTSLTKLRACYLRIPPLAEQQEIVDYLDTAFAKIDAMKANAAKALEESKALFQSALKQLLEPKEGWEEKYLKDIANYSIGLTYKPTNVCEDGTIVLRSSNIQDGKLDLDDIVRVNAFIKESLYVQKGDVLMCSRNGSARLVGKVCIIPDLQERMTYGTFMMIIRSEYNPLLYHYFDTDLFRTQIKHGEANMINQITRYMLDEVKLYLPPADILQEIVTTLDSIKSKVDQLQENYDKIVKECDTLKQAILRQVFE